MGQGHPWRCPKRTSSKQKAPQNLRIDTILLPGILHESSKEDNNRTELANDSDDEVSNEGSTCDIDDSAFHHAKSSNEEPDDEVDDSFLGEEWGWDHFKELGDNDPIPGPEETDHYNGRHGLKPNVGGTFETILQCIFQTTCMDRSFSRGWLRNQINMHEQL